MNLSKIGVAFGALLILLVGIGVGWLVNRNRGQSGQESQSSIETTRSRMILTGFVLIAFLLVIGAG